MSGHQAKASKEHGLLKAREIQTAGELIKELEALYQQNRGYIFRGQPNKAFSLIPSAFRGDVIMERLQKFPASPFFAEWCSSNELKEMILPPFPKDYVQNPHVRKICDLTFYVMHYNYFLARHVQGNQDKFDRATLKMFEMRPPKYWEEKANFFYFFQFMFNLSIGRITFDGKVINHSVINEELAGYDESLPQHYDTQTAAMDFTRNPYIALYFALKNIPLNATHFSIYAFKELQNSKNNPVQIKLGNMECKNSRIVQQEGLFIFFRYACLYYFVHGVWPSVEIYMAISEGVFELVKFDVPVNQVEYLKSVLVKKGITEAYLFPDLEVSAS